MEIDFIKEEEEEEEEKKEETEKLTNNNKKEYKFCINTSNRAYARNRKDIVLECARDLFVRHKFDSLKQLSHALMLERRIPGFLLMKYFFVLLYSIDPNQIDVNKLKTFITEFIFTVPHDKYQFLLEVIFYMLYNKNILLNEKSFIIDLRLVMERRMRRAKLPLEIELQKQTYLLYEEYLNFLEWKMKIKLKKKKSRVTSFNSHEDEVLFRLTNKIKNNLEELLRVNGEHLITEMNMDLAVIMLLKIYDFESELNEAFITLKQYTENNPNHLNGYIYLYKFILRYPYISGVNDDIRVNTLKNIIKLAFDCDYTFELIEMSPEITKLSIYERISMLVNYLAYVKNRNSKRVWELISKLLENIMVVESNETSNTDLENEQSEDLDFDNDIDFANEQSDKMKDDSTDELTTVLQFFTENISLMERIHFKLSDLSFLVKHDQNESNQNLSEIFQFKANILEKLYTIGVPLSPNLKQYYEAINNL
ncbi:hypothetical protein BLOT_000856 [Blomia tropicalis]|nr:hypothetical protein BLOT_000856 [Blomia tropicalis]